MGMDSVYGRALALCVLSVEWLFFSGLARVLSGIIGCALDEYPISIGMHWRWPLNIGLVFHDERWMLLALMSKDIPIDAFELY